MCVTNHVASNMNVAKITWPRNVCVTNNVASNVDVAEITGPKICARPIMWPAIWTWPKSRGQKYVHDRYCGQQCRPGRNHVAKTMCMTNTVASNADVAEIMWPKLCA